MCVHTHVVIKPIEKFRLLNCTKKGFRQKTKWLFAELPFIIWLRYSFPLAWLLHNSQCSPKGFYKYENAKVTKGNATLAIFNNTDQSVKLYNHFSFQGNVLRKLIIFCNVMLHLVPHGNFPLDVTGRFASKAVTPHGPVDKYSFLKSENYKPESASFLARLFLMIRLSESS